MKRAGIFVKGAGNSFLSEHFDFERAFSSISGHMSGQIGAGIWSGHTERAKGAGIRRWHLERATKAGLWIGQLKQRENKKNMERA